MCLYLLQQTDEIITSDYSFSSYIIYLFMGRLCLDYVAMVHFPIGRKEVLDTDMSLARFSYLKHSNFSSNKASLSPSFIQTANFSS